MFNYMSYNIFFQYEFYIIFNFDRIIHKKYILQQFISIFNIIFEFLNSVMAKTRNSQNVQKNLENFYPRNRIFLKNEYLNI
jgi:hypothetical protein